MSPNHDPRDARSSTWQYLRNTQSISWRHHIFQKALEWRCSHCDAPYPEDGSMPDPCDAAITLNVVIHGYYEDECSDEGSVFPFHNEHEAMEHAKSNGLDLEDVTFWIRQPTDEELAMIRFGARIGFLSE